LNDIEGNVYNFTVESMKSIVEEMYKDEIRSMRFLSVGCGNAIFLTLVKMCKFHAEVRPSDNVLYELFLHRFSRFQVAGIDLQPVITNLQIIQTHCGCPEFQEMRLDAVDVLTPAFHTYVQAFRPTHASCFSALAEEETAFLAAMRDCPTVTCVAVTEKRSGAQFADFAAYGFERTSRIAVQMAGIRKRRYVLIARRRQIHSEEPTK
jgi:hypothetical protein